MLAFNDINPQAPHARLLVIPKRHIASLNDLAEGDDQIVGEVVRRAAAIANERGISAGGFRTVFNTNREPVRRSFTSTCTSSAAAASPGPRADRLSQPFPSAYV